MLKDFPMSTPAEHEPRYKRVLNYHPDYLEVKQQKKQREVNVEYGKNACTGKFFIRVWKGDQNIEYINIDKDQFCGVQRWHFTKRNSGWKNTTVEKFFIAILLNHATYVFQQMNRDSISENKQQTANFLVELENVMKEDLGIKNWWKCVTCHSSNEQSQITLHLTKSALSMVDGKEHRPACLKRWDISEVKDCQGLDGDGSKFVVQFHSGCKLKCASGCKSQEIIKLMRATIRPTIPPRPKRKNAFRTYHSYGHTQNDEIENSYDQSGSNVCTLPSGWRPGGMTQSSEDNGHGNIWDFMSAVSENTPDQNHEEVEDCTGTSCGTGNKPITFESVERRKNPFVRQRSVCSGCYTESNCQISASFGNSRRSSSYGDLADIKDMDFTLWGNTEKVAGPQPLSKRKGSETRSTMKLKLDRITKRDQMSIRKSVHEATDTDTCDKGSLTKQVSIWEFEPHSKQTSDVVYTLKRMMDRKPPEKDTLGLPWVLYHTVCCKLIPDSSCPGLTKDWRFLAENIGFHNEDIQMIASFIYQTPIATPQDILLQCWQDRHNRWQGWYSPECTAKNLVKILEKMDRRDIAGIIKNAKKKPSLASALGLNKPFRN
ncbi:uncharacterized protein LOC135485293 isoform X2 [Lineus longissimus]|uniref:uncharacterized protein LOC135485293 isoform X2 n=1 Tax=Lineus longissimus TaxID=88925 RepID=UPI00315C6E62